MFSLALRRNSAPHPMLKTATAITLQPDEGGQPGLWERLSTAVKPLPTMAWVANLVPYDTPVG